MFAARCIGVSLAVFVLVYTFVSLVVCWGWRLIYRALQPRSARAVANLLFLLRLLPLAASCAVTVFFTMPSFLLMEPRDSGESVGTRPALLGVLCIILLALGVYRVVAAQLRTSRAMSAWLNGSTILPASAAVPVFQAGKDAPSFTVAGVCAPKVLVSEAALAMLTPGELSTALRHEIAHVRAWDNLKKLLFRFSVFPGMKDLETLWAEQTEMAADDAAVSNLGNALDLAAALIKVSRLSNHCPPEFATALLHDSIALRVRVQRLFEWRNVQTRKPSRKFWLYTPALAAAMLALIATYGSILSQMHVATEWLVR